MHKSEIFALQRGSNTLLGLEKMNCDFNAVEVFPSMDLESSQF
jgi:hypothetical protein